jgi:hypothetical protein
LSPKGNITPSILLDAPVTDVGSAGCQQGQAERTIETEREKRNRTITKPKQKFTKQNQQLTSFVNLHMLPQYKPVHKNYNHVILVFQSFVGNTFYQAYNVRQDPHCDERCVTICLKGQ